MCLRWDKMPRKVVVPSQHLTPADGEWAAAGHRAGVRQDFLLQRKGGRWPASAGGLAVLNPEKSPSLPTLHTTSPSTPARREGCDSEMAMESLASPGGKSCRADGEVSWRKPNKGQAFVHQ